MLENQVEDYCTYWAQNIRKVFRPYVDEGEFSTVHFDKMLCCSPGNRRYMDVHLNSSNTLQEITE